MRLKTLLLLTIGAISLMASCARVTNDPASQETVRHLGPYDNTGHGGNLGGGGGGG